MFVNIDNLDAAHEYDDMGFSTIPLDGKKPAHELLKNGWKEYQTRRPHEGERQVWYGFINKVRRNIAIVTGSISGIAVVDVDSPETANWWFAQGFPDSDMMTGTSLGRGHIYFRLRDGQQLVRNRVKCLGRELDIRGEGGYVVAPPSVHPDSGREYKKIGSWNLKDVPYFDELPIDLEEPIKEFPAVPQNRVVRRVTDLKAYLSRIESISGQNGSNACFRVACVCRDECGSFEEAWEMLNLWNQSGAAVPPWSEKELLHKLESAFQKGASNVASQRVQ